MKLVYFGKYTLKSDSIDFFETADIQGAEETMITIHLNNRETIKEIFNDDEVEEIIDILSDAMLGK